jgi:metallo-beta-lactamase class B
MNRRCPAFFQIAVITLVAAVVANPRGQGQADPAQVHVATAKAAARTDYPGVDALCAAPKPDDRPLPAPGSVAPRSPTGRTIPPQSGWYAEPVKVFDNLYFVGGKDVSSWAVTTSEGIVLIDSLYDYSVEPLIVNGLKKLNLDPTKIKYVIVTHGHGDHDLGAKFLQERYGARVVLSEADWAYMRIEPFFPFPDLKPRKDVVATDGEKLALGDTTLTLYVTPGHTPGTLSILVPLKDGNQRHVGAMWGGVGFNFPRTVANFQTYNKSATRFRTIVEQANADVLLTNHANQDATLQKISALAARKPGAAHPFVVGTDGVTRFLTVVSECAAAQTAWLTAARSR